MFDEARLERLIAAYFDQELKAEEKRELEEMLLASSRAREIFLDRAEWHGLLREQALQGQAALLMGAKETPRKVIPFRRKAWLGAGLAACLAFAWWMLPRGGDETPATADRDTTQASDPVALLAQAIDVKWAEGGENFRVGSALPKGWLKIERGTLRLEETADGLVKLSGPVRKRVASHILRSIEALTGRFAGASSSAMITFMAPPRQAARARL